MQILVLIGTVGILPK